MFAKGLVDLDELILRCRDETARGYISEAVACYKTGAYRAAIVASWVAVVYDFVHKLRELELTGDKRAAQRLNEFETIQKAVDIKSSLEYERRILDMAKDEFELLSDLEYRDLSRLQEDRNRCAHPSMVSVDEIYQPSAELARAHIRNAVEHMLQRPPVQGKSALDRLMADLQSEYFPIETDNAVTFFRNGPLARPRESLVRNFAIVLMKALLSGELTEKQWLQHASALNAVRQLHRPIVEQLSSERLNDLIQRLDDTKRVLAVKLLQKISDTWQYLREDSRLFITNYVREMPDGAVLDGIPSALDIPELKDVATERLNQLGWNSIHGLIFFSFSGARREYVDKALTSYSGSDSFSMANNIATNMVIPLVRSIDTGHIKQILAIARENDQVLSSFELENLLIAIRSSGIMPQEGFDNLLNEYGFQRRLENGQEKIAFVG